MKLNFSESRRRDAVAAAARESARLTSVARRLLLKKKKYAALVIKETKGPDGQTRIETEKETKGRAVHSAQQVGRSTNQRAALPAVTSSR